MTHSGLSAERALQLLEPILAATLLIKLFHEQLHRKYRRFSVYLLFTVLQALIPVILELEVDTNAYGWFYFLSQPLVWGFGFFIVLELFDLVLAEFKGIRSAARLILKVLAGVSVAISVGTALPSVLKNVHDPQRVIRLYFVAQRTIVIELLFVLAAVQFVLLKYRLTLPRNTVYYSIGYALYFTAFAVQAFFISELGPGLSEVTNVAAISVSSGCLLFWILALNRHGEAIQIAAGPKVSEHERAELRARLIQISEFVTSVRKPKKPNRTGRRRWWEFWKWWR